MQETEHSHYDVSYFCHCLLRIDGSGLVSASRNNMAACSMTLSTLVCAADPQVDMLREWNIDNRHAVEKAGRSEDVLITMAAEWDPAATTTAGPNYRVF